VPSLTLVQLSNFEGEGRYVPISILLGFGIEGIDRYWSTDGIGID
jgi:hypothetical protein